MYRTRHKRVADSAKQSKKPDASCLVHMDIKESFKLGHAPTLNISLKNHIFPKKCTVQGIRESQIAQNNEINRTLHALYIWIENLSYNEESFKLGHAPT